MNVQRGKALRIAIIGCGRAAQQHVEAIALANADSASPARVVAAVDADDSRADGLAHRTGASVRSLAAVLQDAEIDCVSICAPPDVHAEIAVAALRAGKAVLIEKPVTRTTDELDAICSAAEATGLPAVAMLQHRGRLPDSAFAKPWGADACASLEVIRPRESQHYLAEAWRHDPSRSGGGHVAHLGVHLIDLACLLLGTPNGIVGFTDCRDAAGIDTRAVLAVRFPEGAHITILASAHPAPRSERLHIVDGERELIVTDSGSEYRDRSSDLVEKQPSIPTPQLRAAVYKELWAALSGAGKAERFSVARARGVTAVLEQVRWLNRKEEAS